MNLTILVSLIAGTVILLRSWLTYVKWVRRTLPEPPPATPPRSTHGPTPLMLRPPFAAMVATHVCLGLHLIFEAGALQFDSVVLHKIGLTVSMMAMMFAVGSLELLTRRNFGSPVVAAVVLGVTVWNGFQPMEFESFGVLVRGQGHELWALVWGALFIYWNVCLVNARRTAFSASDGSLLGQYGWSLLNVTLLIAVAVAYVAWMYSRATDDDPFSLVAGTLVADPLRALGDFRVLQDAPSFWSLFAGFQVFILPRHMRRLRSSYVHNLPPMQYGRGPLHLAYLTAIAIGLTTLLYSSFPVIGEVADRIGDY